MVRIFIYSALLLLCGCSSIYYNAMEKFGVHKREILADRVKEARDTQKETGEQFKTALEQFRSVVNFQGGDLEKEYRKLNSAMEKSTAAAQEVRQRIHSIEQVSSALFKEWRAEIDQYHSDSLRAASLKRLDLTKAKYAALIETMKNAESRLEPALVPMRDQVLFMKHNLNAKAIAGLDQELLLVQSQVDQLLREMQNAIAQADAFIATLQTE